MSSIPRSTANSLFGYEMPGYVDGFLEGSAHDSEPVPTGLDNVDDSLDGGLRRGQVTVLCGPPGAGTSMLALNVVRHTALRRRRPTLLLAPDSTSEEVHARLVSAEARIPTRHLRSRSLDDSHRDKLRAVRATLTQAPLIISAGWLKPRPLPLDGATRDYGSGLELAVIDATPDNQRTMRGLKVVAQERGLAVVLTAKTAARGECDNEPSRPRLSDLRAPPNLVELADLIISIDREDLHHDVSSRPGEAELEILKHRYSPTRRLPPVLFQGHYARFVDLAQEPRESRGDRAVLNHDG